MDGLLLAIAAGFGRVPGAAPWLADLVQRVSWSLLVCMGLALGAAASRSSPPIMGLTGLFAAPLAFGIACLGAAVASLARRPDAGVASYAAAGAVAGVVFGAAMLLVTGVAPVPGALLGRVANELLFPVGCALALCFGGLLAPAAAAESLRPPRLD
jgi:hypothetical protein